MSGSGQLRIGELSRRSGVSPELLRAWERRYGLLRPSRSSGGLRLYSTDDLERVQAMRRHLADGLAAAEAAARVSGATPGPSTQPVEALEELRAALAAFDEARAQAVLDDLLAATTIDTLLSAVVIPYLEELGRRWERGEASVAEEHFASSVLRGRLLGLARGWGRGFGPVVVLACAPGEQHDLALISFGLALRARGWRIVYLGADTPIESVADAAKLSAPTFVVISSVSPDRVTSLAEPLRALGRRYALCLGGGAVAAAADVGAIALGGGPVEEADRLTALQGPGAA